MFPTGAISPCSLGITRPADLSPRAGLTEGENLRRARQFGVTAIQSYFFKRRLVVTAGYRLDEATDYVYGWNASSPPATRRAAA